ncbi:hypothetical protein NNJEOMEG_03939 [Fundidesulfovibrio magnetotacticus]|uniref:Glutamine cyclotransferase n=1 Tax=Fundidesulfovibrio magnetotacticus TaxID=2730080 RepID=A0A6V8M622_9BACT|nr:glutaminyl-peptide cyclotransferase [Fundidesulfovibrio magnetotacticus]GFK96065.1 hypothetical protein NNJEOMEG_03939 [Fundidesulfovibrio magnetotacticus]
MTRTLQSFAVLALALVLCLAPDRPARARELSYTVTATLPHDEEAFTQGLLFAQGQFFESTGLYGQSTLRRVDPATGKVLARRELDRNHFGEGLALLGGVLYQLTWRQRLVLLYDAATLEPRGSLPLETEGWGIAATPFGLVTSDGTPTLTWRDPLTFKPGRSVAVTDRNRPVERLNELEWAEGWILANVWHDDRIAVVSPATGKVAAWIACAPLRARLPGLPRESDLNGVAWDPAAKRLYVTGKNWPAVFQLKLEEWPAP